MVNWKYTGVFYTYSSKTKFDKKFGSNLLAAGGFLLSGGSKIHVKIDL